MDAIWNRVFELAERGRFSTSPNPRVGAVVVSPDGRVVGEGFHERAGGPHAEVAALAAAGAQARGATVYVNLEPCAHQGRTPPCVNALAAAEVRRVVCSLEDPDPRTSGYGVLRLKERGMEVEVGPYAERAARLNEAFLLSVREKRPFVHLKWASSLDGKTATVTGSSRWVTGEEARADGMRLREECDAILVGAGTVIDDNPLLTRRLELNGSIVPHRRIVLDGRLRVPSTARVFGAAGAGDVWLVTVRPLDDPALTPFRKLRVHIESLPAADGGVDLRSLLGALHALEVRSVLVEGGGQTAWLFVAQGLADRVTAYIAPTLIGGATAPSALSGAGIDDIDRVVRLESVEVDRLGTDLKVSGRVMGAHRARRSSAPASIRGCSPAS